MDPNCMSEAIKQNIETFEQGVRRDIVKGAWRGLVLVVGCSRSGKSTVMNVLAGKKMSVEKVKGRMRIDVVGKEYAGVISENGFEKISITHGHDSGSKFPNYIEVGEVQYWESPGVGGNKDPVTVISNAFYVHKILSVATGKDRRGVKFICVEDYRGIDSTGGKCFYDCIEIMCQMFQLKDDCDLDYVIDATVFVFNKVSQRDFPNDTYSLERFIEDVFEQVEIEMLSEGIEKLPDLQQATIRFVGRMKQKVKENKLKYLVVPGATHESDVNCITNAIQALPDVMKSCVAIVGFKPKVTVSKASVVYVLSVQKLYEEKIRHTMKHFSKNLFNALELSGQDKAHAVILDVVSYLQKQLTDKASGGASKVFLGLIDILGTVEGTDEFKDHLNVIKETIQDMDFLDKIIGSARAGAEFSMVLEAIKHVASLYLSKAEFAKLQASENKNRPCTCFFNHIKGLASGLFSFAVGFLFQSRTLEGTSRD